MGPSAASAPLTIFSAASTSTAKLASRADDLGEIEREAVGGVEIGGRRVGELLLALLAQIGEALLDDLEPALQGLAEADLLVLGDAGDELAAVAQLGVGGAHALDHLERHLVEEGPLDAEALAVADGRRITRRSTYSRLARSGITPSAMRKAVVRA